MTVAVIIQVVEISFAFAGNADRSAKVKSKRSDNGLLIVPAELSRVRWMEKSVEAFARAEREEKPVLLLNAGDGLDAERKIPGGKGKAEQKAKPRMRGNPLVVEAVESLFVPLLLAVTPGGEGGTDGPSLASGPGVHSLRILDSRGGDLVEMLHAPVSLEGLLGSMVDALESTGRDVPPYLAILCEETSGAAHAETAIIAVHCFWEGEVELGPLEGVVKTVPGWVDVKEVVEIHYDPEVTSFKKLLGEAMESGLGDPNADCNAGPGSAQSGKDGGFAADSAPKHYMANTTYAYVPMTETQAILVDGNLYHKRNPLTNLSPRQLEIYGYLERNPRVKERIPVGGGRRGGRSGDGARGATGMLGGDLQERWNRVVRVIYRESGGTEVIGQVER